MRVCAHPVAEWRCRHHRHGTDAPPRVDGKDSTVTTAEQHPVATISEEELVSQWRFDQLHELGFNEEAACLLAESDADLNRARSLVATGCPLTVALQILI
jgi:hypothetical protein